ncbi:glutathione peroxidase [Labilibaculum euxinus]
MSFAQESIYQFTVTSIDGSEFNFADLKGKKIMIVNTASKCGFTPQYELLEALYKEYQDKDFVIVGFPANNFLWQEPGTNEEIKEFCTKNYGVSFPMMSKISVKGNNIHPIYSWLTQKSKNGVMDSKIKWNFQKYLIDENGKLIDVLFPKEKPNCEKVISWLEQ